MNGLGFCFFGDFYLIQNIKQLPSFNLKNATGFLIFGVFIDINGLSCQLYAEKKPPHICLYSAEMTGP